VLLLSLSSEVIGETIYKALTETVWEKVSNAANWTENEKLIIELMQHQCAMSITAVSLVETLLVVVVEICEKLDMPTQGPLKAKLAKLLDDAHKRA
jgi:hypothetical protein